MKSIRELNISPATLSDEILTSDRPIVLRGLLDSWPLVLAAKNTDKEAAEYLLNFYSGEPVLTFYGEPSINGRVFYGDGLEGFNFKTAKVRLEEVFRRIDGYRNMSAPPTFYVGSTKVERWFPGLRHGNDLNMPGKNPLVSIWMGNKSVISSHFDFPSNLACNVVGKRRFTLFPPDQIDNLYVGPIDFTPAGRAISLVDLRDPDLDRFPKFSKALESAVVVELEVGDALYLPSMWWHHVEGLNDFNVLINYWWRNTPLFWGNPDDSLRHAILNIRNLPEDQRRAWKKIFDFYVFNENADSLDHIPERMKGVLGEMDETEVKKIKSSLIESLKR